MEKIHMRFLLVIILLYLALMPISAQDNDDEAILPIGDVQHFIDLLNIVPITDDFLQSYITYGDYQAVYVARGLQPYSSWQEFDTDESLRQPIGLFSSGLGGIETLFSYMMQYATLEDVIGIDFFAIERTLQFGNLPSQGYLLQGENFSQDSVDFAHVTRGYTQETLQGIPMWCAGDVGCDGGHITNVAQRSPVNIFGGDLGRQFPVAFLPDESMLFSSPDMDIMRQIAFSYAENTPSALDYPDIRALAESLRSYGSLRNAYVFPVLFVSGTEAPADLINPTLDINDITLPATAEGGLPFYAFGIMADMYTEEAQQVIIALSFFSEDDAQAAADLFPDRLLQAQSTITGYLWRELLSQRGITPQAPEIYVDEAAQRWVLTLNLTYPHPEEDFRDGSSDGYLFLRNALARRDLAWLIPSS
jgi:hypothetical protein